MTWTLLTPWKSLGTAGHTVLITTETGGHFFKYDGH